MTDREANGGLHRHGHAAAPSTREAINVSAVPDNVHRKDSMFVETSEGSRRNHRVWRGAQHTLQAPVDIDRGDVAHVLAARVPVPRGKVDANEIIEHERLRRLG